MISKTSRFRTFGFGRNYQNIRITVVFTPPYLCVVVVGEGGVRELRKDDKCKSEPTHICRGLHGGFRFKEHKGHFAQQILATIGRYLPLFPRHASNRLEHTHGEAVGTNTRQERKEGTVDIQEGWP